MQRLIVAVQKKCNKHTHTYICSVRHSICMSVFPSFVSMSLYVCVAHCVMRYLYDKRKANWRGILIRALQQLLWKQHWLIVVLASVGNIKAVESNT